MVSYVDEGDIFHYFQLQSCEQDEKIFKLQKADLHKNNLMAMMGHDQKAPLGCSMHYNTNVTLTL